MEKDSLRNLKYIQGNTVRKVSPIPELDEPLRVVSPSVKKNREKAIHMNFGYILFLTAALCLAGFVLVKYISIQADIKKTVKHIAVLESEYNDMSISNNLRYQDVLDAVNLQDVKKVALEELGMVYADESQVISFEREDRDYVRQYSMIP